MVPGTRSVRDRPGFGVKPYICVWIVVMNLWPGDAFGGMWLAYSTAAGIPVLILLPNRNHITARTEPQPLHQNLQIFELKPKSGPPEC